MWIAPECRPWCRWSLFNEQRSREHFLQVAAERIENIWQNALCVVLCEHQLNNDRHFHLEQPNGSLFLQHPNIVALEHAAQQCRFDMCLVGGLKDPKTKEFIRKQMSVLTTSKHARNMLHNRFCRHDHNHHQIAGSTKVNGQNVPMSAFTELYPRKFARQVAESLIQRNHSFHVFAAEETEFDHPTKRRRLGQKSSVRQIRLQNPNLTWEDVMAEADQVADRVGPSVIQSGDLHEAVQRMCPNHDVKHLVLCKGTDRMMGPNTTMYPGEAPLRRMICIRRRYETIEVEDEWEPWERLSYLKLRRKCTPARVNLAIFAKSRPLSPETDAGADESIRNPTGKRASATESEDREPDLKRSKTNQEEGKHQQSTSENTREEIDLSSTKHGPKMLSLKPDQRVWLIKIHKNLGHPGAAKMQAFCKQMMRPPEVIEAIPHIKCSTCIESKGPAIPRPSVIHEEKDFGDIVSMDRVTWTNKKGKQFHFYHFVDHGTTFQTATCAPCRNSEAAQKALTSGWIAWAGAPGLLCLDSATEFGTDQFLEFLQKHGIKERMIRPEASWQNSRAERHGGILQEIITKMDLEESIETYDQLETCLAFATQTKNQWSRHRGFPPEILVFGKLRKYSASVSSDLERTAHSVTESQSAEGIRFHEELAIRERARKPFSPGGQQPGNAQNHPAKIETQPRSVSFRGMGNAVERKSKMDRSPQSSDAGRP